MIPSFETGAIFTIEDRASAILADMGARADALAVSLSKAKEALTALAADSPFAVLTDQLAAMSDLMTGINASVDGLGDSLTAVGTAGSRSASEMAEAFRFASVEIDGVTARLTTMRATGGAGGIGGGGVSEFAEGASGGFLTSRLMSLPMLAAGFATYEAAKAGAHEDLFARIALQNMGLPLTPDNIKAYEDIAANTAQGTIFGEAQTAGMLSQMSGVLGFTGAGALDKFRAISKPALYMGELASLQGLGNPEEAAIAGIQFAHMTGRYDPDDLSKGLNKLFNVSQLTHTTPAQQLTVQKYAIPLAKSMGMDPDDAMELVGFFEQMGLKGSTAGTGFGQMLQGLLRIGGPLAAQQADMSQGQFEKILGMREGTLQKGNLHLEALQQLGLDNVFDDKGKVQTHVLMSDLIEASKKFNPHEFAQLLSQAFTVRGGREAALLDDPDITARMERFAEALKNLPSIAERQKELAEGTAQQFGQTSAAFASLGAALGLLMDGPLAKFATVLTGLVTGLDHLLRWMTGSESFSDSMDATSKTKLAQKLAAPHIRQHNEPNAASTYITDHLHSGFDWVKHLFSSPASAAGGGVNFAAALRGTDASGIKSGGNVTIQNMTVNGAPSDDPKTFAQKMMDEFTHLMSKSQNNNLGTGEGTFSSPFTSGVGY